MRRRFTVWAIAVVTLATACGPRPTPEKPEPAPLSAEAYSHYLRGRIAMLEGDSDLARREFANASTAAPDEPEIVVAYIDALIETRRRKAAVSIALRARKRWPRRADVALLTGRALRRERRYAEATTHLEKALALDHELEDAAHELALTFIAMERPDEADRVLSRAIERAPESTALLMRLARLRHDRGDDRGAEPITRAILELRPSYTRARVLHAQVLRKLGRSSEAIKTLRLGFTLSGARPRVGERLFVLLMEQGDHRGAVELLTAIDTPDLSEGARVHFGYLLVRAGQPRRALRLARTLAASAASTAAPLELEAFALARMMRFEEAARVAQKIAGTADQLARARHFAAEMFALAGRFDSALALVEGDADSDPRTAAVVARVHELAGDASRAREVLESARDKWPDESDLTLALASFELRAGRASEAIALGESLLAAHPGNTTLENFLGFALADSNVRLGKATRLLERALSRDPDNTNIIDSYGWLQFRRGKTARAARHVRRAWRLSPAEPEILFHLARIEESLGHRAAARRRYREALSLASEPSLRRRIEARIGEQPPR